jgi:hypothetical protein
LKMEAAGSTESSIIDYHTTDVTFQKTVIFIVTAVRTASLTTTDIVKRVICCNILYSTPHVWTSESHHQKRELIQRKVTDRSVINSFMPLLMMFKTYNGEYFKLK